MSINVQTIAPPPSVLAQVVTAVNATSNEVATKSVVLDPTGLLMAFKTINKSFGLISFSGSVVVTAVTLANTFYIVSNNGFSLNTLSSNFALTGLPGVGTPPVFPPPSRLTYNGTVAARFKLSCCVNILSGGANAQNVTTQLSLNGVLVPGSIANCFLQTNSVGQNNYMTAIVNLNPNDYVECQLQNTTANNLTVTSISVDAVSLQ